jgi:hypothetical protein
MMGPKTIGEELRADVGIDHELKVVVIDLSNEIRCIALTKERAQALTRWR